MGGHSLRLLFLWVLLISELLIVYSNLKAITPFSLHKHSYFFPILASNCKDWPSNVPFIYMMQERQLPF